MKQIHTDLHADVRKIRSPKSINAQERTRLHVEITDDHTDVYPSMTTTIILKLSVCFSFVTSYFRNMLKTGKPIQACGNLLSIMLML